MLITSRSHLLQGAALASVLVLGGCETSAQPTADGGADPCAPGGELHGDHCDCEPGYEERERSCVPVLAAPDAGAPAGDAGPEEDPCGPHGESHGDHCDCDPGYTERDGVCAPPPACVGPEDALEPNDGHATASPWTSSATPVMLHSCPLNEDWFAVELAAGDTIAVTLDFDPAAADLDTYLWAPGADVEHDEPAARSDSTDSTESFEHTATIAGTHLLLVYGYDAREVPYSLTAEARPSAP